MSARTIPVNQIFNDRVVCVVIAEVGPGCFSARVNGKLTVISSRTPLLDACRCLLDAGADSNSWIVCRHADSETESLRGKIGILARLTVEDRPAGGKPPRFIRHRPMPNRAEGSPPVRKTVPALVEAA